MKSKKIKINFDDVFFVECVKRCDECIALLKKHKYVLKPGAKTALIRAMQNLKEHPLVLESEHQSDMLYYLDYCIDAVNECQTVFMA